MHTLKHIGCYGLFIMLIAACMTTVYAEVPVSGYDFLQQSTREMQDDDFANPGMTFVDKGKEIYIRPGDNDKTCQSCHGKDGSKFDIKRIAQYPMFDSKEKRPLTLQNQINICVEDRLDNIPYVPDCVELVALETFVRHLARGEKVNVDINGPLKPFYEKGKKLYNTRFGQADMSCTHCHEVYQGQRLRGQKLSQGHSNGFPEYRLGASKVISLHQRFRQCFISFRADPYDSGSRELINLEVYVHGRGNGLPIETPAVRY